MATRIYGTALGDQDKDVTEGVGSAVAAKSMEFTFDLAQNLTRSDVLAGLERIKRHILADDFPPA